MSYYNAFLKTMGNGEVTPPEPVNDNFYLKNVSSQYTLPFNIWLPNAQSGTVYNNPTYTYTGSNFGSIKLSRDGKTWTDIGDYIDWHLISGTSTYFKTFNAVKICDIAPGETIYIKDMGVYNYGCNIKSTYSGQTMTTTVNVSTMLIFNTNGSIAKRYFEVGGRVKLLNPNFNDLSFFYNDGDNWAANHVIYN